MSACKEAIMKVRKMACLPAALEAILDAAVRADEQHQGEPVKLPARESIGGRLPGHEAMGWNACLDEIAKLGPLFSRPAQGEPVAYQARHSASEPWFFTDKPGYWEWRPLYTHADSAEVERLREQVETLRLMTNEYLVETERLRAQLAEAHSLLHEVGASGFMVDGQIMPSNEAVELQDRVDSAICARAEPRPAIAWSVIETPPSESPAIQTTISLQR